VNLPEFPWLTWLIFFPLMGAALIALMPANAESAIRRWATVVAVAEVAFSLPLWTRFIPQVVGWQFVEKHSWLPALGSSYYLGVDGISVLLVLLTTVITAVAVIASGPSVTKRVREFYALLLALETGMLGTFMALDLLLFYVFWEGMLIPMYLLIGVWGGPRRIYAAIKFFLYTMFGSVLMLVAILWLYFTNKAVTGVATFELDAFYRLSISPTAQMWLFLAFALAFAIKVPMFPFHTWLPDAHVEAPTAGSVILAAILLKMGTFGFIRYAIPLFPVASVQFTPWIVGLAIVGIIYGALVAMVQPDLKKLVAYSSVSHLGFCMLGLYAMNPQGLAGAMMTMINHGISTGALFLLVGVLYERRHSREIAAFGGIAAVVPVTTALFVIATLSSIGLPGLNGFVGEFLILLGTWNSPHRWWAVAAATGVILSAVYMLSLVQRVFWNPLEQEENRTLPEIRKSELVAPSVLDALMIWIGVRPSDFLDKLRPSIEAVRASVLERPLRAEDQP